MNFGCYHIDNTQRSISAHSCAHLAGTAVPCAAGFDAGPMEPLSLLLLSPKALPLQPEPFQTQQLLQPCLGSAETCPMPRQASSRSLWESGAPGSPHNLFPLPQALTFPDCDIRDWMDYLRAVSRLLFVWRNHIGDKMVKYR